MVAIKLRNGRVLEARPLPGSLYEATLASGKTKIYALAELLSADDVDLDSDDKEGGKMKKKIYHYLAEVSIGAYPCIVRKITTNPDASTKDRYERSAARRAPVEGLYAINSGSWCFALMENTLIKSGRDFTVSIIANADLAAVESVEFDKLLNKSNFAFANAKYAHFFRVDGETEFGLSVLNISIDMAKKSAKRLQELFRAVEMSAYLGDDESFNIEFPEVAGDELLYDGHSYVRKSFMIKMAYAVENMERRARLISEIKTGKLVEVILRVMTPNGLIKGNATIVPNKQISADIVTHPVNMKAELRTDGYSFATAWEHHPMHMAIWDRQSEIDLPHALPERAIVGDTMRLVSSVRETIASGELPKWLLLGEQAHDDSGTPDMEQLSETVNKSWMRWQLAGYDVRAAQNLTYMGLGGIVKRMNRSDKVEGFHRKMWVPMTNAGLFSVVTWESATRLGGLAFPGQNRNIAFYDERIGFVMPGRRFIEGAPYHGGWDQDDMVKVIRVKVWCSDLKILNIHRGKTVPASSIFPAHADDARDMVLLVRSPNGPGEWTIEECNIDTLPILDELSHNDITVVDIAKMPMPSDVSAQGVNIIGMPESTVYSGEEMTREDARAMLEAQMKNPGVGLFCNAMMVFSSIREGYPGTMLDYMENVVDTVQQGFDAEAFDAIAVESTNILQQVYGSQVDRAVGLTRITDWKTRSNFTLVDGRYTRMQRHYNAAVEVIRDELQMHSLQMRCQQDLVQRVWTMGFGSALHTWAMAFYDRYTQQLSATDARFNSERETHPFRKMIIQNAHKLAMEMIVNEMVEWFNSLAEEDRNNHVLALWKYITLTGRQGIPYGLLDRIIFQPNAGGRLSVMDILIEALSTLN